MTSDRVLIMVTLVEAKTKTVIPLHWVAQPKPDGTRRKTTIFPRKLGSILRRCVASPTKKGKCIEFTEGDEDRKGKRKPQLTTKIQIFKALCLQLFSLAVFDEVKLGCERKDTHGLTLLGDFSFLQGLL